MISLIGTCVDDMTMKTVSLQLSQQLKDNGYPQDSEFSWYETVDYDDTPRLAWTDENRCNICMLPKQSFEKKYASPLADEILDQLPREIDRSKYTYWLRVEIELAHNGWACQYTSTVGLGRTLHFEEDVTIADAAAKMWLYLKKEGLL